MISPNKHTIRATRITVCLILTAMLLRNLWHFIPMTEAAKFIAGNLRSLIYIALFAAWGFSLRHRVLQARVRRYLAAVSLLMVFWMIVRTAKFFYVSEPAWERCLWHLYYLPLLFIPLFSVFIALFLGRPEEYRLPRWTGLLYIPTALLFLLVLTNDLHQGVFTFSGGVWTDSDYGYGAVYWFVLGWELVCALTALGIMISRCRIPRSHRVLWLPLVPLSAAVLYSAAYVLGLVKSGRFLNYIAGDMTVVLCLFICAILEGCIQCGLIRTNTHYGELFQVAGIRAKISDEAYHILLSSTDTQPLPAEIMRQTEDAPVLLGEGLRLCGAPIRGGHILWWEDVSALTAVISELADSGEYLTTRGAVLQKEVETRQEELRLAEKNSLYNKLMEQTKNELALYDDLIGQLAWTEDTALEKRLTAKLAVLCTHIKRRGNLVFLSEKEERIPASEVKFALEEWLANLRLCGVRCGCFFDMSGTLRFAEAVYLYDAFQKLLMDTADQLHSLLVTANMDGGRPGLLLNLRCDAAPACPADAHVTASGEGEWVVKLECPEGGLQ